MFLLLHNNFSAAGVNSDLFPTDLSLKAQNCSNKVRVEIPVAGEGASWKRRGVGQVDLVHEGCPERSE
jgi:hypothetical protein